MLAELVLSDRERQVLVAWVRGHSTPQSLALRARIVLACADTDPGGLPRSASAVAGQAGVTVETVCKWRRRFLEGRLDGLGDALRPGRVRTVSDEQVAELVRVTLETKPKNATHWSTRSMPARTGMSQSTVSRVWRAFGLQPHRAESFKLSTDPFFVDKVHDVVGLDPPERALVLSVDEKAQIQASGRSQPMLPIMPGVPERASHDYVRSGTTTLFAALDLASGQVIGSLHRQHRATEFKKFLAKIDKEIPGGLAVHVVCDNYATLQLGVTPGLRLSPCPGTGCKPATRLVRDALHGMA